MQLTSANFQLFFENATDLLFIATPQGQMLACNRIFRDTIGQKQLGRADASTGESNDSLADLFDRPNWPTVANEAHSGPTAESIFELRTKAGDTVVVKGKVFVDDDSKHLCGLFRASSLNFDHVTADNVKESDSSGSSSKGGVADATWNAQEANLDRQLVNSLTRLHEQENQDVGGRIHDGFVQDVVGAQMWLESVKEELTGADKTTLDRLATVSASLLAALNRARIVIGELRPGSNHSENLQAEMTGIVEELRRQTGASISLTIASQLKPLESHAVAVALRIVQQALRNAVSHAQPNRIIVSARCEGDDFVVSVNDDGAGFDVQAASQKSAGIRGMHNRAQVLDGELTVSSQAGHGTQVLLRFPSRGRFSSSNVR